MTTAPATVPMRQGTTYGANGMLKTENANFYPPSPPIGYSPCLRERVC